MDLYIYDHCPFCNRVRIAAGLLGLNLNEKTLMSDDEKTPKDLIGKKLLPILIKSDGEPMGESMDIVAYLNQSVADDKKIDENADEFVQNWVSGFMPNLMKLTIPRSVEIDFEEFKTQEARDYFINSKNEKYGDFAKLIQNSQEFIEIAEKDLNELEEHFIKNQYLQTCKKGIFCFADVNLYAFLRLASMVKGLEFPQNVKDYMLLMEEKSKLKLLTNVAV